MNEQDFEKKRFFNETICLPLLLILAGCIAYFNSFGGPFIFDDISAIVENPNIRSLLPLGRAMTGPPRSAVAGRPMVSLTLAVNYALCGYRVWGYHLVNLAIHLLGGMVLYGIVRRTFLTERLHNRFGRDASVLGCATALIWIVHPIQTESVTYIIQRAESLMCLFYLLTLYAAIRAMQSNGSRIWPVLSVFFCALGMATKESMVTAPVMIFLYDRMFGAGSFSLVVRRRWRFYAALAATWLVLAILMLPRPRSESAGFSIGISAFAYALSQFGVILHYLKLCFWPRPLCLYYQWPIAAGWNQIAGAMLFITVVVSAGIRGLIRNRIWSYPVIWFFGILAPTSSFVPVADLAFEHRVYLPLAGIVVFVVGAAYLLIERIRIWFPAKVKADEAVVERVKRWIGITVIAAVAAALTVATIKRNADYGSVVSIWQRTVEVVPDNSRAHNNLASALQARGKIDEAIGHLRQALLIDPNMAEVYNNLGMAFIKKGKIDEAITYIHRALQLEPTLAMAHNNLGIAYLGQARLEEAIDCYREAIKLSPGLYEAYNNIAVALRAKGDIDGAVENYSRAVLIKPDYLKAHRNLAKLLVARGKLAAAAEHFDMVLEIEPTDAAVHNQLALVVAQTGQISKAVGHFREAIRIRPQWAEPLNSLAWVLATQPDIPQAERAEAVVFAERAVELSGGKDPSALDTLAAAFAAVGRYEKAVETAEKAIELAEAAGSERTAEETQRRLDLYRKGRPYRELLRK